MYIVKYYEFEPYRIANTAPTEVQCTATFKTEQEAKDFVKLQIGCEAYDEFIVKK